jgi:choline kinase
MKIIFLAAGEGTRLRPLTLDKPKCMVSLFGKPMIERNLDTIKRFNFNKVVIVTGYEADKINYTNTTKVYNPEFAETNMVYSLFKAENEFDDDMIISYSDIVYSSNIVEALVNSEADISVVIDRDWKKLWSIRMENPLDDAETLKIDKAGFLKEIGKKALDYSEIEGQYIGLLKIKKTFIDKFSSFYKSLDSGRIYDGKPKNKMFMTSLLQELITSGVKIKPIWINGGWCEVDSVEDLTAYEKNRNKLEF